MSTTPSAIYPDLVDKRVVVTGGGSGIGAAFTAGFAAQGAKVSFLDIADSDGLALQEKLKTAKHPATFFHCDLTNLDEVARVFESIHQSAGATDILINNAANDVRHNMDDIDTTKWDANIAVNLRHLYFCAKAVVPAMRQKGNGAIINLGSISWHLALPNLALYMTAKAGIEAMSRGLARELGPDGIRVNTIIPGAIKTPKQTLMWHTPEAEAKIFNGQCLKERVMPEDVANFALFLASSSAGKCTGREYYVDGGYYGDGA
jgi:NAD(P)-dependent dehydrogenase (short-subunit alcohol dehydrogenase family)